MSVTPALHFPTVRSRTTSPRGRTVGDAGASSLGVNFAGDYFRPEGKLNGFPFDIPPDKGQFLLPRMKSIRLANGLTRRTANCLTKAGIPLEKEAIVTALQDGTLYPHRQPRLYGRTTHREVCRWVGIDPTAVIAPGWLGGNTRLGSLTTDSLVCPTCGAVKNRLNS